jgi:hypothetical protein
MVLSNFLIQNIVSYLTSSQISVMEGGKLNKNIGYSNQGSSSSSSSIILVFLFSLLSLLLKGYIVYLCYNMIMPQIINSLKNGTKENDFVEITYMEAVLLVILTNTLFCC